MCVDRRARELERADFLRVVFAAASGRAFWARGAHKLLDRCCGYAENGLVFLTVVISRADRERVAHNQNALRVKF